MAIDLENLEQLTELFRKLGADDPAGWAASQIEEGFNQLHRFLFLRQAWKLIITEDNTEWIDACVEDAKEHPRDPYSGIGLALERVLAKGVDRDDIVDIVRGMQAALLYGLCRNLEDPFSDEPELKELGVSWALGETINDTENFTFEFTGKAILALYESVLSTDPTGREMMPRPRKKS